MTVPKNFDSRCWFNDSALLPVSGGGTLIKNVKLPSWLLPKANQQIPYYILSYSSTHEVFTGACSKWVGPSFLDATIQNAGYKYFIVCVLETTKNLILVPNCFFWSRNLSGSFDWGVEVVKNPRFMTLQRFSSFAWLPVSLIL